MAIVGTVAHDEVDRRTDPVLEDVERHERRLNHFAVVVGECAAGRSAHPVVIRRVEVSLPLMLLRPTLENVGVSPKRVIRAHRKIGHQLALEAEDQFIRFRRLHVVVQPGVGNAGAGLRRIDVVETLQPDQLVALDHLVAIVVVSEEDEIRVVRERIGGQDRAAELIDVPVVAGSQKSLLARSKRIGQTDARTDAVPFQRPAVAAERDARQLTDIRRFASGNSGEGVCQNRVRRHGARLVLATLLIEAQTGLQRQVAGDDGIARVEVVGLFIHRLVRVAEKFALRATGGEVPRGTVARASEPPVALGRSRPAGG